MIEQPVEPARWNNRPWSSQPVESAPVEQPPVIERPPHRPRLCNPRHRQSIPVLAADEGRAKLRQAVQVDLAAVNALIAEMDAAIGSGAGVTEADLERLRSAIAALQGRSSLQGTGAGSAAPEK